MLQRRVAPVAAGSITCLLGSNGSGKTTLIRSILGLTPPRAGRITFEGAEITGLPTHKVIAAGIACIPEGRKVFPKLTRRGESAPRRLSGTIGDGDARAHRGNLRHLPAPAERRASSPARCRAASRRCSRSGAG